jgi:citrate lyase alpha subunit
MASIVNGKIDIVVTNLATCLTYLCEMNVLMHIFMAIKPKLHNLVQHYVQ